jgi:superfamily II DNA helicase RecQ
MQRMIMAEQQAQDANSSRPYGVAEHALSFLDKLEAAADFAAVQQLFKDVQGQDLALQKQYVCNALCKLYNFEPRPGQIEGVWQIIFARRDLILIAKTSFGKSVLLQAPSAIVPDSTSLLILPLDKIGEEQYEKIARFPQARPCLLKQDTVTPMLLEDVKAGNYTHILLGLEQALSKEFRKVIRDPHFQKRLIIVAIDEAYLIS